MSTMWELEQEVRKEAQEVELSGNIYDQAFEIADSNVPVYTSDIMELAADDVSLATDEPELGPAFDGSPTPANIVAANIFERLNRIAYEVLSERGEEEEDD